MSLSTSPRTAALDLRDNTGDERNINISGRSPSSRPSSVALFSNINILKLMNNASALPHPLSQPAESPGDAPNHFDTFSRLCFYFPCLVHRNRNERELNIISHEKHVQALTHARNNRYIYINTRVRDNISRFIVGYVVYMGVEIMCKVFVMKDRW